MRLKIYSPKYGKIDMSSYRLLNSWHLERDVVIEVDGYKIELPPRKATVDGSIRAYLKDLSNFFITHEQQRASDIILTDYINGYNAILFACDHIGYILTDKLCENIVTLTHAGLLSPPLSKKKAGRAINATFFWYFLRSDELFKLAYRTAKAFIEEYGIVRALCYGAYNHRDKRRVESGIELPEPYDHTHTVDAIVRAILCIHLKTSTSTYNRIYVNKDTIIEFTPEDVQFLLENQISISNTLDGLQHICSNPAERVLLDSITPKANSNTTLVGDNTTPIGFHRLFGECWTQILIKDRHYLANEVLKHKKGYEIEKLALKHKAEKSRKKAAEVDKKILKILES